MKNSDIRNAIQQLVSGCTSVIPLLLEVGDGKTATIAYGGFVYSITENGYERTEIKVTTENLEK
jgi:hypothetical protein